MGGIAFRSDFRKVLEETAGTVPAGGTATLDFSGIDTVSRAAMDELLCFADTLPETAVETVHMKPDLAALFAACRRTHSRTSGPGIPG